MMPEPVYTAKLQQKGRLTAYVHENLRAWYQFFKTELGLDIENGDLRVVYGYRKSSGFGMAAVNNGSTDLKATTELTFSVDDSRVAATGCKYRWHNRGCVEAKAGPSLDEKQAVITPNADAVDDPVNQCLFISTIDIKFSEEEWLRNHGSGPVPTLNQTPTTLTGSPSFASSSASGCGDHSSGGSSTVKHFGGPVHSASLQAQPLQVVRIDNSHCPSCLATKTVSTSYTSRT